VLVTGETVEEEEEEEESGQEDGHQSEEEVEISQQGDADTSNSREPPKEKVPEGRNRRSGTKAPTRTMKTEKRKPEKKPAGRKKAEEKKKAPAGSSQRKSRGEGKAKATKKEASSGKKRKAPEKNPKEGKKKAKKRKVDSDTSSTASSSSDSDDSATSSSDSSSSSSPPSSDEKHSRKKGGARTVDMDLLEELWATEDRPKKLQSRAGLKGYTIPKLMKLKEQFVKETEKKGLGTAIYGRDKKPKSNRYKKMKDDGDLKLHPARFASLPVSEPKKYWDMVPTCKIDVYRHIPLQHLGVKNVPEATIVKMHNRKAPVELAMLRKEVTEVRHVQEAVYNYVAVLRSLHPMDHAGLAIQKTLIDADWCRHIGTDDKQRVAIMKNFFDDTAKENSGRAVRREPPLDTEQVRTTKFMTTLKCEIFLYLRKQDNA